MYIVLINYRDALVFLWIKISILYSHKILKDFHGIINNQCPSHFGKRGQLGQMQLC